MIQIHKRLKGTLFILTKYNMHIFQVIPSFKLQTTPKQHLNGDTYLLLVELFCYVGLCSGGKMTPMYREKARKTRK